MATGEVPWTAAAILLPDGSTSNLAARSQRGKGTGTAPVPFRQEIAFPDASTTGGMCNGQLPANANASPAPILDIYWKANATTGAVRWSVQVAAFAPAATTAQPAHNYATANLATATTGATTARQMNQTTITLTNADSIAAGQPFSILIQRLGADAADTLTVDAEVTDVRLTYTI